MKERNGSAGEAGVRGFAAEGDEIDIGIGSGIEDGEEEEERVAAGGVWCGRERQKIDFVEDKMMLLGGGRGAGGGAAAAAAEGMDAAALEKLKREVSEYTSMLLSRPRLPYPPPLCSICQHGAPLVGRPPRKYSYKELNRATGNFSAANFLGEGGFGAVHRGVLPDGQSIAVKQYKLASTQGDMEFCAEVEVLNCAQHRNVVALIGFCMEENRRLLVYEFVCNGSLNSHLRGQDRAPLEWQSRHKIAVGAARGLRYLHEECRVGCIVHRDMRPHNILLTHDFEPMVGDFGLARSHLTGDFGIEKHVHGSFGYLAPEYARIGQITEKADIYSFGVVLLELVTGRKAVDISRLKGQQCLTEWARPLLEQPSSYKLLDPCLKNRVADHEVYSMMHAASLCIRRDPQARPKISQVLRILEGDNSRMQMVGLPFQFCSIAYSHIPFGGGGVFHPDERPDFSTFQRTQQRSKYESDSLDSNYEIPR
ncbi:protein MpRLK-Pelle_PERK-2b [Marchantia polymorpha subsp. ruderalis]|uniref:Protein kinase domain-containing protein n=1 Tax=Marchantia polymorpha TaxID=3197 RepID=A0A2R6XMU4_MARPO|nr:hypothetical protein MARPO_0008s0180 [Marchantia polymorpha]BBN19404.1 hypothetical protein Mp_8g10420 [Marchantia polymorpha subsp. ruderalis]|eukprot:PTQ47428.1 hypothetical protein MARPO_0008s0180 [Marchantia polymorpha]